MHWRLRRAERGDAPALSLVAGATFLETYAHFMPRADLLAHLAAKASPGRFAAWIDDGFSIVTIAEALPAQAPLGYTVLTLPDLPIAPQDGDIELLRIYALAPTLGGGLGPALMVRAIEDARAAGCRRMLLGTHPENHRAQRFYRRSGFEIVGRRIFRVGEAAFDDPVFARPL